MPVSTEYHFTDRGGSDVKKMIGVAGSDFLRQIFTSDFLRQTSDILVFRIDIVFVFIVLT